MTFDQLTQRQQMRRCLRNLALYCVAIVVLTALLASCGLPSDTEIADGNVDRPTTTTTEPEIHIMSAVPAERIVTTTTIPPTTTTTHYHPPTATTIEVPVSIAAASEPVTHAAVGPCGGWEDTVRSHFGDETAKACDVIRCETGGTFDPTIENPNSTASGLPQFLDSTWVKARRMVGADQYARASHAPGSVQIAAMAAWKNATSWSQWVCG